MQADRTEQQSQADEEQRATSRNSGAQDHPQEEAWQYQHLKKFQQKHSVIIHVDVFAECYSAETCNRSGNDLVRKVCEDEDPGESNSHQHADVEQVGNR